MQFNIVINLQDYFGECSVASNNSKEKRESIRGAVSFLVAKVVNVMRLGPSGTHQRPTVVVTFWIP